MQITTNTTPFLAELFASTDKHGRKHCVVVVKATFAVDAAGECRPADEQAAFVYADEHHGDAGTTSIRYETDFAPIKPNAEVLINADALPPDGRPVAVLEVALAGPGFVKRAVVTGDRRWQKGLLGPEPSNPLPFASIPLTWDRAFGGSDLSHERIAKNGSELRNLVGVGFHLNSEEESILGNPLPNIERMDDRITSWYHKPEPIGFGPLGRGWQPRIRFAGTYDQRWMDERLPFLPEDFDDRYFQSAPMDQQFPSLSPGSTYSCVNMSRAGRFVVRVPPLSVPVDFLFDDHKEARTVVPDTLILEPNAARILVTARTSVPLPRKFSRLREIQVGQRRRGIDPRKTRFANLDEALTALRRSR